MSALGPGCVKTQKNSAREKIDRSEQPLCDFLDAGNGHPTHENVVLLRFYTAWAESRRSFHQKVLRVGNMKCLTKDRFRPLLDSCDFPV